MPSLYVALSHITHPSTDVSLSIQAGRKVHKHLSSRKISPVCFPLLFLLFQRLKDLLLFNTCDN